MNNIFEVKNKRIDKSKSMDDDGLYTVYQPIDIDINNDIKNNIINTRKEQIERFKKINKLDSIVTSIIDKIASRAEIGFNKYGTDMDRTDLSIINWIDHAIEEQMDNIIYLEKIKKMLVSKNNT